MFDTLREILFLKKGDILYSKGLADGRIIRIEDDMYNKMTKTIIACLPVSLYIKYADILFVEGTCIDRSLYMFLALDDAYLVRADCRAMRALHGKDGGIHGWVEIGDYVYDPSFGIKCDKDLYYKMYEPTKLERATKEEYLQIDDNAQFVKSSVSRNLDDFRISGSRRLELGMLVTMSIKLAILSGNADLIKELNDYLTSIEYDESKIQQQRNERIQENLRKGLI